MMKSKFCIAALAFVAATFGVIDAEAASYTPAENFYTAGSSAQFNTFGLAASSPTLGAFCGTNHWSGKNGGNATSGKLSISIVDPRSSTILAEPANIWIAWDNNAANGVAGNGVVCFYATVDSVVGVRAYAARATLSLGSNAVGTADAGLVPLLPAGSALPQAIYNIVNNAVINAANTDIRPEDAKFATMRVMTSTVGAQVTGRGVTGFGYGTGSFAGTPIKSSQSSTVANPVDFTLDCNDTEPVSGATPGCGNAAGSIREYFEVPIGAAPVLVIANVTNTAAGHLGDGNYTNINRFLLRNVLEGNVPSIRDLGYTAAWTASSLISGSWGNGSESAYPLNVFIREPLSGTYNTMEWSIPMSLEMELSQFLVGTVRGQETGVVPSNTNCTTVPCTVNSGNPLYQINAYGGYRARAIGTGEMITAVANQADSIGYSFWGYSNFAGKQNSIKYLTVDGVDPLYSGPSANPGGAGYLPQAVSGSYPNLTFPNVVNGSYPIWSKYRLIWDPFTASTNVAQWVTYFAQLASDPSTGLLTDFVPAQYLQVFHSHYPQVVSDSGVAFSGNNGFKTGVPETGGDMGGAVLTVQSELDFINDTNNQQVGLIQ